MCEKLLGTGDGAGGGRGMISHSPKCDVLESRTLAFGFLVCSLENLFFLYNEMIITSKLPFHIPLVMKCYNVFSTFVFRL